MEWSLETYRLEEIERKFPLPCVIRLTEGFYSDTDTEGFSQGDIISIDSKLTLYKVAANFAYNTIGRQLDPNNVEQAEKEILVPLNYKGKLKVLTEVKDFNSVEELSAEFPRYAKVRKKMKVHTERNEHVTIQADTVIELIRIIPGHSTKHEKQPAKLEIRFQNWTGEINVAVPLDVRGKFRTEPDNNEYTIKEVMNRLQLPQLIRFVDDEIRRVCTQDLLEGIENMRTITSETLRLNRLVIQNVLVGHYKPVDENVTRDTERFRQRTLAVLPLDKREIRVIEVHVLKGVKEEDIYEQVFLVRNVSKTSSAETVEGSLYIDFVMRPRMKIISNQDTEHEGHKNKDIPPLRPPKPRQVKLHQKEVKSTLKTRQKVESNEDERGYVKYNPAKGSKEGGRRVCQSTNPFEVKPSSHKDLDGYEIPLTRSSFRPENMPTIADVNFNSPCGFVFSEKKTPDFISSLNDKLRSKDNLSVTAQVEPMKAIQQVTATMKYNKPDTIETTPAVREIKHLKAKVKPTKPDVKIVSGKERNDQVKKDERNMLDSPIKYQRTPHPFPFKGGTSDRNFNIKPSEVKQKPIAHVSPSKSHLKEKKKQFKDLNNIELVQRLELCGLDEFGRFCEKENLNGEFFTNMSPETLSNEMNLTGIHLYKFLQMRDINWIPN